MHKRKKTGIDGTVGAIVVGAGSSRRMAGTDKIFLTLLGQPVVSYSLQAFNNSNQVDSIVFVTSSDKIEQGRELVNRSNWDKVIKVCKGGDRRQDSVRMGLENMTDETWVIVHDAARPLVEERILNLGLMTASQTGAAVAAVPVQNTIKLVNPDRTVFETLNRDRLWEIQTPQVFSANLLRKAHAKVHKDSTDDASMVEQIGGTVKIFSGSDYNIKITTTKDVLLAESILKARLSQT